MALDNKRTYNIICKIEQLYSKTKNKQDGG